MHLRTGSLLFVFLVLMLFAINSCTKPKPIELLLNGEFDTEQSIGPKDSPTAYDGWTDWHVDFVNNSGGWGSVFRNTDPGHGENDFKRVISWAKGNYTLALSQQVSAPKGSFVASVALLLGSGNYTTVALRILAADGKTVLAEIDKPQDRTTVSEEASNNTSDKDWQILTVPVEIAQAQDITYMVDIKLGSGGVNPFVRIDDASLQGFPK